MLQSNKEQKNFICSGKRPPGMCLVGEMSVGEVSIREVSVGEVSGRGNVRRGCVRRGTVRTPYDSQTHPRRTFPYLLIYKCFRKTLPDFLQITW